MLAPVNLDFARESILAQSGSLLPGWDVDFRSANIGWDWSAVRPWLVMEDVTLIDRRDRLTARIPQAEVGIGINGILAGVGVSTIELQRGDIYITDIGGFSDSTDDSLFADLFGKGGIPEPELFIPVTEAFSRFANRLLTTFPAFESITFDALDVSIYRGETLSDAQFSASALQLLHDGQDINLSAQVSVSVGGNPIDTRVVGRATPSNESMSLLMSANDFHPASFAGNPDFPKFLNYLDLPVGLSVSFDLNSQVGVQSANLEASLGEGELFDERVFPYPAPIDYGLITATYDNLERSVSVDRIDLALKGRTVTGSGLLFWQLDKPQPGIQFDLKLNAVTIEEILKYWPTTFYDDGRERGARAWISRNMIRGDTANVDFSVAISPDGVGELEGNSPYLLTFDFDALDTGFVRTMPPILNASGSAKLTLSDFTIQLETGSLLGMPISGSLAHLKNINVPNGAVGEFSIYTQGPVQTVMRLIDRPPLRVAEKADMDIGRLGGDATLRAKVIVPLSKDPPKESILYDVSAQLTNVRVDNLLDGEGLSAAEMALKVNNETLTAAGVGLLNGVPVNLRWVEDFSAKERGENTSLIVLSGQLDGQDLAALNVDVEDYLLGKAQMEIALQGSDLKLTHGSFTADVSATALAVPQLSWVKPVGEPATITGELAFKDGETRIAPLVATGDQIDVNATLVFTGGDLEAAFDVEKLGRNRFDAELTSTPAGTNVTIDAAAFDLAPYLGASQQAGSGSPQAPTSPGEPQADVPLGILLRADSILLRNGERWEDADLALTYRDGEPVALSVGAVVPGSNSPLRITLSDTPNETSGFRPLLIEGQDGGAVLRGLGFFAHIEGGSLNLVGSSKGWADNWQLEGLLKVRDGRVLPKDSLSEDVTEGTIAGLDSYLEDGPLTLDVLDVPFTYDGDILDFNGLKANGPTVGITMEGEIATTGGILNVNGVVVPAYGLNSLLGNIPIVGGLFTGGDGKGLFGVAYRVKGSTANPDISVNALSGLAPGFLRLLFEGRKGRVADVEPPAAEATSPDLDDDTEDPLDDQGGLW